MVKHNNYQQEDMLILKDKLEELLEIAAKSEGKNKENVIDAVNRLLAVNQGEKATWKSTVYPKQTIRVGLKIDIPETLTIKEVLEELQRLENELNSQPGELKFTIELGS